MIWQLTEDYRIRVIPLNFVLEYLADGINPKTKEPTRKWKVHGYYSTLQGAIAALPDREAQHPEVKTIGDLTARLDGLAAQLSRRVGK